MADSTQVDSDALLEFAHRLFDRSNQFGQSAADVRMPIAGANLGASDMVESRSAATSYADARSVTDRFLADVHDGLLALSYVAATVADHYRHSDADQADQLSRVDDAFAPAPGQASISSRRAEQEAALRAARSAAAAASAEEHRLRNQVGADSAVQPPDPEELRFLNQVDGGRRPDPRSAHDQYSRAADEVVAHTEAIGRAGSAAEDGYDPTAGYAEAQQAAERLSDQFDLPFVVEVDEHGTSEAVPGVPLLPDDEPDSVPDQTAEDSYDQQSSDLARALGENG